MTSRRQYTSRPMDRSWSTQKFKYQPTTRMAKRSTFLQDTASELLVLCRAPVQGNKGLQPVTRLHASSATQAALNSHGQIPDISQHQRASNGAEAPTSGAEQPLDQSAEDTLEDDEADTEADDGPSPPEYAHPVRLQHSTGLLWS